MQRLLNQKIIFHVSRVNFINCELCGKTEDNLLRAIIESVELNVCKACSKFGKALSSVRKDIPREQQKRFAEQPKEEKIELIVEDYPDLVKKKRESMGLSQKDFAIKLNEKESTLHHIETGHLEPSLALARKLEKFLNLKLVEEHEENVKLGRRKADEGFTLGDFIKIKK